MFRFRPPSMLLAVAGFVLSSISRVLGLMGDDAHAIGDRAGAIGGHGGGLIFIIAAMACYVCILVRIVRRWTGSARPAAPSRAVEPLPRSAASGTAPEREDDSFDPDAIMARYLAQRNAAPRSPAAPPSGGFGRKRV